MFEIEQSPSETTPEQVPTHAHSPTVAVIGGRARTALLLSSLLAMGGGSFDLFSPSPRMRRSSRDNQPTNNGVEPKQPEKETRQMRRARERKLAKGKR